MYGDKDRRTQQSGANRVESEKPRERLIRAGLRGKADSQLHSEQPVIHELFEEQVRRRPNALALLYEGQSLTYAGLNRRANQVAAFLRGKGVGPDRLVGLFFERSPWMITALLGILKAGGAYVPIDPSYPRKRISYLLEDSSPHLVLTDQRVAASLPDTGAKVVALDDAWKAILRESDVDGDSGMVGHNDRHLAYVIYTSGSTGDPKGVAAEHRGAVNRIAAQAQMGPFSVDDICCQKTSIGFVDAVFEILGPLCYGRPLVLVPNSLATDPMALARVIQKERITRLISVPSLAKVLLSSDKATACLQGLRGWTLSGEELREELLLKLHAVLPKCDVLNLYGSSEVAGDATYYVTGTFKEGRVPIGKPICNTSVYILDGRLQPVPSGVAGEIYVAGAGLARGYLNRPELTAQRFLIDPFAGTSETRMYKTGDLGRWRPDGLIDYLGRNDEQVKIRGFRVEPGEVEAQLVRHSEVKEAVVIARNDRVAGDRLVAYVIPQDLAQPPSAESLREHLKTALPEYMVPSAYVALEAFPSTPSGKLDRRSLPAPDASSYVIHDYEAPQGEREELLASIWADLLSLKRVGRYDNFFELGGDSLLIVQMLERLRKIGLSAEAQGVFLHPQLAELAAALTPDSIVKEAPPNAIPRDCQRITPEMLPLVKLEQAHIDRIAEKIPGGAPNIQDIYPLAPLQQGLLFHHLMDREGDAYVISTLVSVASQNRLEELIAAIQWAVDRHDVLRTAVLWENLPYPVQVVQRQATLAVEQIPVRLGGDPVQELKERIHGGERFDLRQAPLMRLEIASSPHSSNYYALIQSHHLVCDEESLDLLLREVTAHFKGAIEQLPEALPYRSHVFQTLNVESRQVAQAFFRRKLQDVDEPTAPFGLLEQHMDGSNIEEARSDIDSNLASRVRLAARKQGVSAATLLHAVWALVLSRTAARDDVTYGTVLLGRLNGRPGAERTLGMFINTLPLRLKLQGLTAVDLIQHTQSELAEVLKHEHASLAEAQRASGVSAQMPLFTSLFNYRHAATEAKAEWTTAAGLEILATVEHTNYPVTVSVDDLGEGFTVTVQTDRRIDARRILAYLQITIHSLAEALEHHPATPALSLEVLPENERRQVIKQFNSTRSYPKEKLIQELFEAQVRLQPDAVAVTCGNERLTYQELNTRANQLAWYLRANGVGPDQLVGICVDRSLEMVIGLLGILKAGGAYLPLDPSYPQERIQFMLDDAAPQVVLTQASFKGRLPTNAKLVALDADWSAVDKQVTRNPSLRSQGGTSQQLAYVIYTSGSTGKPKGVMIEHRNVVRLFAATEAWFGFDQQDVWTLFHSFAFDFSVWELWGALLHGGRVVIVPYLTTRSPREFYHLLCEERVTVLNQTPSAFAQLIEAQGEAPELSHSLRVVIFGGEALDFRSLRPWVSRNGTEAPELVNMYGITETTVHVTYRKLSEQEIQSEIGSVVGEPIPDLQTYLLDPQGQLTPIGVVGEIYVGGAGVARGYLNRPELTAERFLPDPFSDDSEARMYRSGDLGRWRSDGIIEYLGRNDEQVKIRGFRIELGEIEAHLMRHGDIKRAVVVARTEPEGGKRLVGYVIPKDDGHAPAAESLRQHLKETLPEHMIPSAFVTLETLPLTTNGKLDRRALPNPDAESYASREYQAPQSEVEELLAATWQELLHVDRVGRNDNFFELGGHSLLMVQLAERLRRAGLSCEIRRVFESRTLADLARTLTRERGETEVPPNLIPRGCQRITPEMLPLVELAQEHIGRIGERVPGGAANIQDIYPLAPLQEGMLFHHLLHERHADLYVGATLLSVSSRERLQALIAGLQEAIDRHDMLRTAVLWEGLPRAVQVVYRRASLQVEEVDLTCERSAEEQIREWLAPERQRMDLRQAPLLRLTVARDSGSDRWFAVLRAHHIVGDNTSQALMMSEVGDRLAGSAKNPPEAVPYRRHVAQALGYAKTHDARAFFRAKLKDIDEPTAPFGVREARGHGSEIEEVHEVLDARLAARLRTHARRLGVSPATMFHAAWALVVSRTAGRDDVVYGTVLLGRMQGSAGAERIMGVFINTLPLRIPLRNLSAKRLVERTQRELVELLDHEQASLAEAQRCSGVAGGTPLFTSLLNFIHAPADTQSQWGKAIGVEKLGDYERTNYPITISVDDLGEGFSITAQTDRAIAPQRLLSYLNTALASLIEALDAHPETLALSLEVLPEGERRQVVETFNDTEAPYGKERLIHEVFEEQVARKPKAVALEYLGKCLTFAELNARANQLAWYLRGRGVGPDHLVGICFERSVEMIVAILGVLKAGGAYVPLDPLYPSERLAFVLKDASPNLVLTQERLKRKLPPDCMITTLDIDGDWSWIAREPEDNPSFGVLGLQSECLAYVIYTSGSTGVPKGVMVEHREVILLWQGHKQLSTCRRVALNASITFDASIPQITQLLAGHTLHVVPEDVCRDPVALLDFVEKHQIDAIDCTPSQLKPWLAAGLLRGRSWRPGLVLVGGEAIEMDLWRELSRSDRTRFYNMYGPTECTVDVTMAQLGGDHSDPHIGRPMDNRQVYILDELLRPVPIGLAGEIYVAGPGIARGYLNRPELTAERFVPNPWSPTPEGRMYKTGDLGCWKPDGVIEYLGRNDDQVKIRGFRIELGEIEAHLVRHLAVKEAVVLARQEGEAEKRLVAYVTAKDDSLAPTAESLRDHLKMVLPDYMVPSAFVVLEAFPLTSGGKLDRRALPAPDQSSYVRRAYERTQGEVEQILASIWQDLLRVDRIGRDDSFFELGGHSLLIVQLMERLRRVGLTCEIRRVFESPRLSALAAVLTRGVIEEIEVPANRIPQGCDRITPEMLPLIDLESEHIARIVVRVPGGAANIQDIYPLAPLQEGILFHHLLNQSAGDTYILPELLSVSSRQRLDELISALQTVINRHDMLRTAVLWEGLPRAAQVVYRQATLPVEEVELDRDRDAEQQIREWLESEPLRMDLRQAPLMRLRVAADPHSDRWYVLNQLHHITCDHVTAEVIAEEVVGCIQGRSAQELPAAVEYRNHVAQALAYAHTHRTQNFFREKLGDVSEPTAPFGLLEVYGDGSQVTETSEAVDVSLAGRIRTQARRLGVSAATVFHAAWALVLSRTAAQEDVVYGTVLLGRLQGSAGAKRILGVFINTLPLRISLKVLTARELVERTQREIVDLLGHEQASLAEAQRCSGISGSAPLFTTLLNFRHSVPNPEAQWDRADGIKVLGGYERTNYPITVSVDDLGEEFSLTAQTDRRVQPKRVLAYLQRALTSLLEALENDPEKAALKLEVLPEKEWRCVVEEFNATATPASLDKLVHELFEEQAKRTPQSIAVEHEGHCLTYDKLNRQANRLARYLVNKGVGRNQVVGICLQRSLGMIVGLLGILKAGAAYLPLDPSYPVERLNQMLEDAGPQVLLTDTELSGILPGKRASVIALDGKLDRFAAFGDADLSLPERALSPENLVYVIYTSGSTGRPKGTAMRHRSMVNLIEWHRRAFEGGEGDRVLQFAALSFDVAFQEIFSTLCTGGTLVLLDEWLRRDARALTELLGQGSICRLFVPPLMLQSVAEYCQTASHVPHALRDVIAAGEQLRVSPQIRSLFKRIPGCKLHNHYGPTETHVVTTLTLDGDAAGWPELPSIGRPIANAKIYLLDGHLQPVPVGCIGEIYIGGIAVAEGYFHRPELTEQRFLADPYSSDARSRLYKTGDVGRWRADGTLEYLGRCDRQVKIRGFRIELAEIEGQLTAQEEIKEAAVVLREDQPGEKRLVAYFTRRGETEILIEGLRQRLKATLPEHMIPSAFVILDKLPLTPSGKLDAKALPVPELGAYARRVYEPPRGEMEQILASIWEALLRLERVGRNDNFFELGGHSLLVVQLMERLRNVGLSCELRRVFERPTLSELAEALTRNQISQIAVPPNLIPAGCERITPEMLPLIDLEPGHIERIVEQVPGGTSNIQDIYPLAPLQEGMLFHHLLDQGAGDTYVLANLFSTSSRERVDELIAALQSVVDRHDALRTAVFWAHLPQPAQVVLRRAPLQVKEAVLDGTRGVDEQLREWMQPEQQRLDLGQAPLMRVSVAADPNSSDWYALLQLHHLVCDNQSFELMLAEVTAFLERRGAQLPPPVAYRRHVAEAIAYGRMHDVAKFFRDKLGDVEEPTAPFGLLKVRVDSSQIVQATQNLGLHLARRIIAQARRLGVTAATVFHAAWALVVARTSSREDVVFGTVLLGRLLGSVGAQQTLGMFINTLPLRVNLRDLLCRELVEQVQRGLIELFSHEQASLAQAQRASGVPPSLPLFTALLNYRHRVIDHEPAFGAEGVQSLEFQARTNYPIMLSVDEIEEGFALSADAESSIHPGRVLGYMHAALHALLEALEANARTPVLELEILPDFERRQVIESFNDTAASYPKEKLIHELFEEQVARTPEKVAVEHEGRSLTYVELNGRANQLARYLVSHGIGPEHVVGICLERGIDMVVGLLGILKAGGAYLPLDPNYPPDRLRHMLEDAAPPVVLTQTELVGTLPTTSAQVIAYNEMSCQIGAFVDQNLPAAERGLSPENPVYIIYTSGSTGVPKGTVMRHRSVVNLIAWHPGALGPAEGQRVLQFAALSFDVAFQEIFSTLCTGGTLILLDEWVRRDARALTELLINHTIQRLFIPPLMLQNVAEHCQTAIQVPRTLKDVITAGEQLRVSTEIREFFRRCEDCRLHNHYGPTETHVVTALTLGGDPGKWPELPPIGRPIANTRIYVLDAQRQPVPAGVPGEIYIGGANVARGYLNRPELTAQRFVSDYYSRETEARLYKTDDLGRWTEEGVLEYLGRNDDQVKIRGYRIELGEIEARLIRHPLVREAVVIVRENEGEKRLVAYVIGENSAQRPTAEDLREQLKAAVPEYMVPSAFVVLESFPLSPNGKLDRKALPAPDLEAYATEGYEPPEGEVEKILAGIWEVLLGIERVGRNDNFFELGGHSLLGTKLINAIGEHFDVALSVAAIFQYPTVERMGKAISTLGKGNGAEENPEVEFEEGSIELPAELTTLLGAPPGGSPESSAR